MLEFLEKLGIIKLHLGLILKVDSKHDCNLHHLILIRLSGASILNMYM